MCRNILKSDSEKESLFINEECLPEIERLEKRLLNFYNYTNSYHVYSKMTWQPEFWSIVVEEAKKVKNGTGRVLEIGAAKSGFAQYLKENDLTFEVAFQDITPRCKDHLLQYSKELYLGPVEEINCEKFDVVFHSYVFEHISRPRQFLEAVARILVPDGCHIIESPRYDLPFYIPPAIRHNEKYTIVRYIWRSVWGAYPDFSIVREPAVFYKEFRRDCDAVHRVTIAAVRNYMNEHGWTVSEFHNMGRGLLRAALEKATRMRVILKKDENGCTRPKRV